MADPSEDEVLHPSHYELGGVEAVDVVEGVLMELYGPSGVDAWQLGCALKYALRAGHKGPMEVDVKKCANFARRFAIGEWMEGKR